MVNSKMGDHAFCLFVISGNIKQMRQICQYNWNFEKDQICEIVMWDFIDSTCLSIKSLTFIVQWLLEANAHVEQLDDLW